MNVVCDLGSVLSVGWAPFMLKIAELFPQLVKSVTWANNEYQAIKLAGIISNDKGEALMPGCELKAVIEFYMPYETKEGVSSSIKFAIGNDVAVNCLIGMSFGKSARLKIDLVDDVVESDLLLCDPFPISYLRPGKHMPNNIPADKDADSSTLTTGIQTQIQQCMAFFQADKVFLDKKQEAVCAAIKLVATSCVTKGDNE